MVSVDRLEIIAAFLKQTKAKAIKDGAPDTVEILPEYTHAIEDFCSFAEENYKIFTKSQKLDKSIQWFKAQVDYFIDPVDMKELAGILGIKIEDK